MWNEYQKKLLEECKNFLTEGKVCSHYFLQEEINGMTKMMKYLTGEIDVSLICKLLFNSKSDYFSASELLALCLTELCSAKQQITFDPEISQNVAGLLHNKRQSVPDYPKTSYYMLSGELELAAENKDLAKITFLLDVSEDQSWERSQLLAYFTGKKDFETICQLELYDELPSLKDHRIFPLLFHIDYRKYPELFLRLYQLVNPEKFLKKIISYGRLTNYLPFLFTQGTITLDTVLFQSGPVKITLQQYYFFWQEVFPAASHLRGKNDTFDSLLENTERLLSDELKPYFKQEISGPQKTHG